MEFLFCVVDSFLCAWFMHRNVRGILDRLRLFQAWCSESLSPFIAGKLDGPAVATGSGVRVLVSNEFRGPFFFFFSTSSSSLETSTTLLVAGGGGTYSSTGTMSSLNRSGISGTFGFGSTLRKVLRGAATSSSLTFALDLDDFLIGSSSSILTMFSSSPLEGFGNFFVISNFLSDVLQT